MKILNTKSEILNKSKCPKLKILNRVLQDHGQKEVM